MLLPAQMGRLIRPDAVVRMGLARYGKALRAEATVLTLDVIAILSLIASLFAFLASPWLGPPVLLVVVAGMLVAGNRLALLLKKTRLRMSPGFWWRWQTFTIALMQMGGWVAHGAALYLLIRPLTPDPTLFTTVLSTSLVSCGASATGIPGGVGVAEGGLGSWLAMVGVPAVHLAAIVSVFRLVTFWIWLPIGWLALIATRRRAKETGPHPEARANQTDSATDEETVAAPLPSPADASAPR
jgi:uncharacterized membrane protein YbhN (UPF0104 family)